MLPFKKILFPVDYSDQCRSIVPYVQEMAGHFSAQLTLVHAYGVGALPYTELAVMDPNWPEEVRQREEQRLRAFAAETFPALRVDSILEEGEPGRVIDKVVQHQGTDLVMMPTHGRGPVRRLLLGSVTAKVLHDVSAAVWTGAGRMLDSHPPNTSCKSILCAVDLSDETEAVIRAALGKILLSVLVWTTTLISNGARLSTCISFTMMPCSGQPSSTVSSSILLCPRILRNEQKRADGKNSN